MNIRHSRQDTGKHREWMRDEKKMKWNKMKERKIIQYRTRTSFLWSFGSNFRQFKFFTFFFLVFILFEYLLCNLMRCTALQYHFVFHRHFLSRRFSFYHRFDHFSQLTPANKKRHTNSKKWKLLESLQGKISEKFSLSQLFSILCIFHSNSFNKEGKRKIKMNRDKIREI